MEPPPFGLLAGCSSSTATAGSARGPRSKTKRRLPADAAIEPWQWVADLGAYGLTRDDVSTAVYWIEPDGTVHSAHRAVAASLRALGGGWGSVGRVLSVPPIRWLAAAAYWIVARNRHRLPGSTPACRVPRKPRSFLWPRPG